MNNQISFVVVTSLATFSNEDENEDEDLYDWLGPGTYENVVHGGGISAGNKII